MRKYKVGTTFEGWCYVTVEAESLEEAMKKVSDNIDDYSISDEWEYISDTHKVDDDMYLQKAINIEEDE